MAGVVVVVVVVVVVSLVMLVIVAVGGAVTAVAAAFVIAAGAAIGEARARCIKLVWACELARIAGLSLMVLLLLTLLLTV